MKTLIREEHKQVIVAQDVVYMTIMQDVVLVLWLTLKLKKRMIFNCGHTMNDLLLLLMPYKFSEFYM